MADFLLSSIMIRTARNGSKYITGKLKNKRCPWENEFDFINFSQEMVKILEPYLSKQKGGTAQQDKNVPTELRTITGCWCDYSVPERFFQKYTKNIPAENINKGDYIRNVDGSVQIFSTLKIFCQYYIDEFGQKVWIKGESPYEVFMREFKYKCEPYSIALEMKLNQNKQKYAKSPTNYYDEEDNDNSSLYEEDSDNSSLYYDDGLDMNQQSEDYWKELGIF